jgi:2-iminobutanoate/2-iminopropanoate deaminase
MMQNRVSSQFAPCAIGPYSQAVIASGTNMMFISGQIPLNPQTMKIESFDIKEQTRQVLSNIGAILKEANIDKNTIVKTTVYLKNMEDFSLVNEEYEAFFAKDKPARACVEVARLPKDALVEIDAIAIF